MSVLFYLFNVFWHKINESSCVATNNLSHVCDLYHHKGFWQEYQQVHSAPCYALNRTDLEICQYSFTIVRSDHQSPFLSSIRGVPSLHVLEMCKIFAYIVTHISCERIYTHHKWATYNSLNFSLPRADTCAFPYKRKILGFAKCNFRIFPHLIN